MSSKSVSPPARRLQNLRDRRFDARSLVQSERTPFEVIHEAGIVRIPAWQPLSGSPVLQAVPLVLVAPLAVNMSIYDLIPERSLVRDLLARGIRVYLIDWGAQAPARTTGGCRPTPPTEASVAGTGAQARGRQGAVTAWLEFRRAVRLRRHRLEW